MKRNKRCSYQDRQNQPQKFMMPLPSEIGTINSMVTQSNMEFMSITTLTFKSCQVIQKASLVEKTLMTCYTMCLDSSNPGFENGTQPFMLLCKISFQQQEQTRIRSFKTSMDKGMKRSLISFAPTIQSMIHIHRYSSKIVPCSKSDNRSLTASMNTSTI